MLIDKDGYLHTSMHELKTNLARYVRMLESGEARAIVLCRRKKPVGLFVSMKKPPGKQD